MKCPKCGYLGFESSDRCRNCGYDFSLAPPATAALDLALDRDIEPSKLPLDLDRILGGADAAPATDPVPAADLPLFPASPRLRRADAEDAPLIQVPSRPRPPLGVRRATPEVPRAKPRGPKPTPHGDMLFEPLAPAVIGHVLEARQAAGSSKLPAAPSSRIMAALVDASLLSSLDAGVLYFTLRLCGLTTGEIAALPMFPLAGFFLLLNGGYFVAFTAVGGQSIGKMALGIKVISQEDESVPVGRATLRTLAYLASALPLGAGFLAGVLSADRLALHDRVAHTRVIRPS